MAGRSQPDETPAIGPLAVIGGGIQLKASAAAVEFLVERAASIPAELTLLGSTRVHGAPAADIEVDLVLLQGDVFHAFILVAERAHFSVLAERVAVASGVFDSVTLITTPALREEVLQWNASCGVVVLPGDGEGVFERASVALTVAPWAVVRLLSWAEARAALVQRDWGVPLPFALQEELWARLVECAGSGCIRRVVREELRERSTVLMLRHATSSVNEEVA